MGTEDTKVDYLVNECDFFKMTAIAWVEFKGKCAYCGEDVISTRFRYANGVIDHLLPKSKYPHLQWVQENFILSCSLCNSLKSKADVLLESERANSSEVLKNNRAELVERVKKYIALKLSKGSQASWAKVKNILSD
jgi:5-methylcytosine-specific restriction endonuclease McrA